MEFINEVVNIEKEYSAKKYKVYLEYKEKIDKLEKEKNSTMDYIECTKKAKVFDILNKNVNFREGEMLYFKCEKGSGYYGRFNRIENNQIIIDICTKGGKDKNKKFIMSLRNFNKFIKIDK